MHTGISLRNGNVLTSKGKLSKTDIAIKDHYISDISNDIKGTNEIDLSGLTVIPGLIDIHTHGIGFYSAVTSNLADIAEMEASFGTTCFIPTLFGPMEESCSNLIRHRRDSDELRLLPQVGGFRLESPYLAYTGAGLNSDLADVNAKTSNALIEAGGGYIRIWDISPELPGATDAISEISNKGIVCSIAHTRANIDQARAGVDAGSRLVTHLFDTFELPEMTDPGVYPVSLTDYLLFEDRISCEIIADGTHVHPILIKNTIRCKGISKVIFVTDSNLGAGLPDGDYDLPGGWGRARVAGPNNGVRMIDRDFGLAGSALTPIGSFRNAVNMLGMDISEASTLCSKNPAALLKLPKGEIKVGLDADMVALDSDMNVKLTISRGNIVYQNL